MSNNEVVLVGRAELDSIFQSLKKMNEAATHGADELGNFGKKTQENLDKVTKNTENNIKKSGSAMRRLASQLYSDFKGLMSLEALQGGLKLSSQFKGAISDSVTLSDTIRRLGGSFGIARQSFSQFQGLLSKGLGDIGASSDAAASALQGLSGMGVKGSASAINLSKGAVMLAGLSGDKGNEKSIAGLLGSTLQSQGKNVNDAGAQNSLIQEVTAASLSSGKKSSEILQAMDQIFSTMDKGMRGKIGTNGMAQMAVMASTVGPAATKALQEYMSKSAIQRMPMEAQGFNIMGKNGGINMDALQRFIKNTSGRVGGDARTSLQTAGFSEEAADGLIKLADQSKAVADNLEALKTASRDTEDSFKKNRGMADSWRASIEKLKGSVNLGTVTQPITDMLSKASESKLGAGAVVGGSAVLAAILAGGGLRGIGGALTKGAGGLARKEAYEAVTGEKVQPVYVTNASEIGGGGAADAAGILAGGGMLAKMKPLLGQAGALAAAGAVGYGVGTLINTGIDKYTQGTNKEGFTGSSIERLLFKMDKLLDGKLSGTDQFKIHVETKEPNLRVKSKVSRGASN